MRMLILAASALALAATSVIADPIEQRQANMKERGGIMRILGPIMQGKADFDAATVAEALTRLEANAKAGSDIDALWPQGSDAGETKAGAAIWSDFDGYKAANAKYDEAVAAAIAAQPQDQVAFQSAFGPVAASCGSCHEVFRK